MYLDFYSLSQAPFHITSDPEFFFLSPSHQEAWGAVAYGLASGQGCLAVFGEAGVGKTALLRTFLTHMQPPERQTIFVCNARLVFLDLLRLICGELGLPATSDQAGDLLQQLQQRLCAAENPARQVVLIIDEAQTLLVETLAQLPLLASLEDATGASLQIVLVGQPALRQTLQHEALRPLQQRIKVCATVLPLTRQESLAYIQHRLAMVSAAPEGLFTPEALQHIVRHARGVPRALNILCTNALIAGFVAQQKPISAALVKNVIAEVRGRKPLPVWQFGLAAAALLLLASLLWLAPWQGQPVAIDLAPRPALAPAAAREATPGPAAADAVADTSAARPPAVASEAAETLDTQAMQELVTRLEAARSLPGDHIAVPATVKGLAGTASGPLTPPKAARRVRPPSKASEARKPPTVAVAEPSPVVQARRPHPAAPARLPRTLIWPQPSHAIPPTNDDGGG